MKIFNGGEGWDEKVNFVDENNVLLGYDLGQCCCEHADWFIEDKPTHKVIEQKHPSEVIDMPGWTFDKEYFEKVGHCGDDPMWSDLDEGGMVIFRIVNGDKEKFIHLFNCHNGYYGHGFGFNTGNETIEEGSL